MADGRGGSHGTGVRGWILYCVWGLGIRPYPDSRDRSWEARLFWEDVLEDFVVWYLVFQPTGRFCSASSVSKYASSVRAWVRRLTRVQLGVGARESRVKDILKGVARCIEQPPPKERHGVSPSDLALSWSVVLPGHSARDCMWRAATAFGVAALARGVEFAIDTGRGEVWEESEHVHAGDVQEFRRGGVTHVRLKMRKRKDLKCLRGKHAVVVLAGGGRYFDAVRELQQWLRLRRQLGLADTLPLFCHADGTSISVNELRDMVKLLMASIGRDPTLYGAHSLRIGGATAALAAGVSPQLIRLMGRWSSDVYEIYCRMSLQAALGVGTAIASADVSTFEGGFEQEHFELQPSEVQLFRCDSGGMSGGEDEEECE